MELPVIDAGVWAEVARTSQAVVRTAWSLTHYAGDDCRGLVCGHGALLGREGLGWKRLAGLIEVADDSQRQASAGQAIVALKRCVPVGASQLLSFDPIIVHNGDCVSQAAFGAVDCETVTLVQFDGLGHFVSTSGCAVRVDDKVHNIPDSVKHERYELYPKLKS